MTLKSHFMYLLEPIAQILSCASLLKSTACAQFELLHYYHKDMYLLYLAASNPIRVILYAQPTTCLVFVQDLSLGEVMMLRKRLQEILFFLIDARYIVKNCRSAIAGTDS